MTSSIFLVCSQKIRSLLFLLQALLSRSVFACKGKLYFLAKKKKRCLHQFFACQCKCKLHFLDCQRHRSKASFSPAKASCIFLQKKNDVCQRNLCVFACESPAYQRQFDLKGNTPCAMLTVDAEQISLLFTQAFDRFVECILSVIITELMSFKYCHDDSAKTPPPKFV